MNKFKICVYAICKNEEKFVSRWVESMKEADKIFVLDTGPAGEIVNFADFYALMPPDNTATVAPGTDISFPQDGPTSSTTITRTGVTSFNLSEVGTYQVYFSVPVSAHLVITQIS